MAKTEDQKRDAYYRRKYGVGLDWYNARFEEQSGCCGICRRPQSVFKFRLAIDHDHGWKKAKVATCVVREKYWQARAVYLGHWITMESFKKSLAIKDLKWLLKLKSCRGLLCPFCNRGLRFYADDPKRLDGAAEYLRRHQNA